MASSDHIPEEIIEEILYNLPVKSLLQCTTVCKSWNSLIKSPNFISTHFRKFSFSNTNNPQLVVLRLSVNYVAKDSEGLQYQYSLCCGNKQLDDKNEHIRPVLSAKVPCFKSAGSCNGLVCLFNDLRYKIILWNPSIRKTLTISKFNTSIRKRGAMGFDDLLGIGFDSNTNDFKILRMMTENETRDLVKADLYSLKSDSLKDITHITPKHRYIADNCYLSRLCVPFFVNGAFHWIACDREEKILKLMVFDVRDEVFGEIMLPECLKKYNSFNHHIVSVIAYGESSIAVTRSGTTDLWVMKEYGVVESWVKMFEKEGITCLEGTGKTIVLGITINQEIILEHFRCRKIVSYDLKTQQIKNHLIPRMHRGYSLVYKYMESLALIDQGKNYSDEIIIPMY